MTSDGVTESQVVGFQPVNKNGSATIFTDTISTINNRVMSYTVKAVDKFLNYSAEANAGKVKIQTDGILDKSLWTASTNMVSSDDTEITTNDDDPDSGYDEKNPESVEAKKNQSIYKIIDNDISTVYNGTASSGSAEITIDMHAIKEITAIKYSGNALSSVKVETSEDGSTWVTVKEGFNFDGTDKQTLWFNSVKESERGNWIGTYNARYVRLSASQADVSIKEIEICGPSGDNIEFMQTGSGQNSIGILTDDYQYGTEATNVIPKGSLIFTGIYKGNPAYNVVILYDINGNIIGSMNDTTKSGQVIFADVPENGNLGETSDGTWVYYVEPGQWNAAALANTRVRAELYRVDDAKTLEGERITSDTLDITIPETLPDITLTGGTIPGN